MQITGLIFFGDSVFSGAGTSNRQYGCAKIVKNSLNIDVSIRGKHRYTSKKALEGMFDGVLLRKEYSHVVVIFGNNDSWFNQYGKPRIDLENFEKNMTTIVSSIRDNGQMLALCNLQPIDAKKFLNHFPQYVEICKKNRIEPFLWHKNYNGVIEKISKLLNVPLIDIRSQLERLNVDVVADDGLHPNDSGHRIIADSILATLCRIDKTLQVSTRYKNNAQVIMD